MSIFVEDSTSTQTHPSLTFLAILVVLHSDSLSFLIKIKPFKSDTCFSFSPSCCFFLLLIQFSFPFLCPFCFFPNTIDSLSPSLQMTQHAQLMDVNVSPEICYTSSSLLPPHTKRPAVTKQRIAPASRRITPVEVGSASLPSKSVTVTSIAGMKVTRRIVKQVSDSNDLRVAKIKRTVAPQNCTARSCSRLPFCCDNLFNESIRRTPVECVLMSL